MLFVFPFSFLVRCSKLSSAPMGRCLGAASPWTGPWTGELHVSPLSPPETQPAPYSRTELGALASPAVPAGMRMHPSKKKII